MDEKNDKLTDINTNLDESFEPYFTDIFKPGETKEQLEIGKEVKGAISSGGGQVKTGIASVTSGYTDFAITGVGFTPKALQITIRSGNKVAWGNADNVGGTLTQRCIYADAGSYGDSSTRLFRFDGTNVGLLVSFDTDGFTVKSDLAATMNWTCFG